MFLPKLTTGVVLHISKNTQNTEESLNNLIR